MNHDTEDQILKLYSYIFHDYIYWSHAVVYGGNPFKGPALSVSWHGMSIVAFCKGSASCCQQAQRKESKEEGLHGISCTLVRCIDWWELPSSLQKLAGYNWSKLLCKQPSTQEIVQDHWVVEIRWCFVYWICPSMKINQRSHGFGFVLHQGNHVVQAIHNFIGTELVGLCRLLNMHPDVPS